MTKRVHFLLVTVVFTMSLAACGGNLLGIVTETYVNQNDASQTLELTTKETVKGFIAGRSPNPQGSYILSNDHEVTSGNYARSGNTYILKSEDEELELALQRDSTLRDSVGNVWRLESRSRYRSFRPSGEPVAYRDR